MNERFLHLVPKSRCTGIAVTGTVLEGLIQGASSNIND